MRSPSARPLPACPPTAEPAADLLLTPPSADRPRSANRRRPLPTAGRRRLTRQGKPFTAKYWYDLSGEFVETVWLCC
jgi:hypothetical protein